MIFVWGVAALLALALVSYVGALAWMYFNQESLLFRPTQLPPNYQFTVPDVQEVQIPLAQGFLSALHFKQPAAKGLIFFLHGNAGDLSTWLTNTRFYQATGFDLFIIDYRGYGKSPGAIESQEQLHADVRGAWEWIVPQYEGRKKVIYGRSLGAPLAAELAAQVSVDLLTLVTPFVSILQATQEKYPWVPLFLVRYPLRTDLSLQRVKARVLILHGDQDELFSLNHARYLQSLHPSAQLVEVLGAAHSNIHEFATFNSAVARALEQL